MEKFACTKDFENYAEKMLAPPMFEFINGSSSVQDSDDFLQV